MQYLRSYNWEWEVVVADDGSTDATATIVADFGSQDPRVRLLQLQHGGKGWAVRHGMMHAQGEYRFLCDADLSMPIQHLASFLPPALNDFDVAIGSREAPGARRLNEPWIRHFSGKLFNILVRLIAVHGISDSQCGFKCFRAPAAEQLFSFQKSTGFSFDAEVLFIAQRLGMRIVEIPIDWYYMESSKVRLLRDAPLMIRDLLLLRLRHRKAKH